MSAVIDAIPRMSIQETVTLWINALRILNSPKSSRQHDPARKVIAAIRVEWERRRRKPINSQDFFHWPSTEADKGSGYLLSDDWVKHGVLQFVGYKVGLEGEVPGVRERILKEILCGPIPPVFEPSYLDEWGQPNAPSRLKKMAETIAALTRNAKRRRDSRMAAAVSDWERDLKYLYYEFYMGKYQFEWPATSV